MPGIFIGNCLVAPQENVCPLSVINTTTKRIEIPIPYVTVEEIQVTDTADVLTLQEISQAEPAHARIKRLREQLRTKHLNDEEKKALEIICEDFCDTFHLENDTLTCTTAVEHEISTRVDSAPVNVRPYRLPEKHKAEVNKQIKKMLDDGIIRPSASQWNAPILVVPKKTDASGKQKLRIVVDFRKLNDLTI